MLIIAFIIGAVLCIVGFAMCAHFRRAFKNEAVGLERENVLVSEEEEESEDEPTADARLLDPSLSFGMDQSQNRSLAQRGAGTGAGTWQGSSGLPTTPKCSASEAGSDLHTRRGIATAPRGDMHGDPARRGRSHVSITPTTPVRGRRGEKGRGRSPLYLRASSIDEMDDEQELLNLEDGHSFGLSENTPRTPGGQRGGGATYLSSAALVNPRHLGSPSEYRNHRKSQTRGGLHSSRSRGGNHTMRMSSFDEQVFGSLGDDTLSRGGGGGGRSCSYNHLPAAASEIGGSGNVVTLSSADLVSDGRARPRVCSSSTSPLGQSRGRLGHPTSPETAGSPSAFRNSFTRSSIVDLISAGGAPAGSPTHDPVHIPPSQSPHPMHPALSAIGGTSMRSTTRGGYVPPGGGGGGADVRI